MKEDGHFEDERSNDTNSFQLTTVA